MFIESKKTYWSAFEVFLGKSILIKYEPINNVIATAGQKIRYMGMQAFYMTRGNSYFHIVTSLR